MTQQTKPNSKSAVRRALLLLLVIACVIAVGLLWQRRSAESRNRGEVDRADPIPPNTQQSNRVWYLDEPVVPLPPKYTGQGPDYYEANQDTPRIWVPGGPLWAEAKDVQGHEEVLAMVEYRFSLHDRKITSASGRMLKRARPISTKADAVARIKDASILASMHAIPGRAFETPEYYIMASMVPDYHKYFEIYKRTHPPEEHPVCDFLSGGYAIRKSDGHALTYSMRYLMRDYGFQPKSGPSKAAAGDK